MKPVEAHNIMGDSFGAFGERALRFFIPDSTDFILPD